MKKDVDDLKKSSKNIIDESEKELHSMVTTLADVTRSAMDKTAEVINKNVNSVYCCYCGTKITKDSTYCKNCGKKVK